MAPDPNDPKTVYVTLGASASRYFAPLGSLGEDASDAGTGHVFKSTDAGETFKDISGNLPERAGHLAARARRAADRGHGDRRVRVAAARTAASTRRSGDNLPAVSVYQISLKPGDPNTLVAVDVRPRRLHVQVREPQRRPGAWTRSRPKTRFAKAKSLRAARRGVAAAGSCACSGRVSDRDCCKGKKGRSRGR